MLPGSSLVELLDFLPIGISYKILRYSKSSGRGMDVGLSLCGLIVLLRYSDVDTL